MSLLLTTPVRVLHGVGEKMAKALADLGILTLADLVYYAPFRYERVEQSVKIADLSVGTTANFAAQVISKLPIRTTRFRSMIKVKVSDHTGEIDLIWFNTPFVLSSLSVGQTYYFTGKVSYFKNKLSLTNPTFDKTPPDYGSLIPIYHESSQINSRYLRKLIKLALDSLEFREDPRLYPVYKNLHLLDLKTALVTVHQPSSEEQDKLLERAKRRLAFDEMFTLISGVIARKNEHETSGACAKLAITDQQVKTFFDLLPFAPTPSQIEAIRNLRHDLGKTHPMHRLIQGEVGSGKTTVAAFALWASKICGKKSLLVCPTKILARQHFETLSKIFPQDIGLYTGKEKNLQHDILVGTHALFSVKNIKPALVIIDEEHRFGVSQRETFLSGKKKPHFLSMTATPIPRTVALTALADMNISVIHPHKTNANIKTWVTPHEKRDSAYRWINQTLNETGGQALIICPFIETSKVETLASVKSATTEFETLKKILVNQKLALLHGKIKEKTKDKIFSDMMLGDLDVLVTTPVVEVGVDIPGANIIVIEGAERYGLAGLHQLRGRVGRRGQDAYCLLFTSNVTDSVSRLQYFAKTYDGNTLAEYDLKHRGSGDLLGTAQHGFDTLKFASWFDLELIETCRHQVELLAL